MKKMLYVQNAQVAPQKPDKKSVKKSKNLRGKIFKMLFQGIEALWMQMEIIQNLIQIFK